MKKIILSLSLVLAMFTMVGFSSNSFADTEIEKNIISVKGVGNVVVKPDMATINIGVETSNIKVDIAQKDNKKLMNNVRKAIINSGIEEKDLKTLRYGLYKKHKYDKEYKEEFVVTNTLTVTVNNIDQVGKVIDASSNAGANIIRNINFGVKDESKYYDKALELAMKDAKNKATIIMKTFGKTPSIPVRVMENGNNGSFYRADYMSNMSNLKMMDGAGESSVDAGDMIISANVMVEYDY